MRIVAHVVEKVHELTLQQIQVCSCDCYTKMTYHNTVAPYAELSSQLLAGAGYKAVTENKELLPDHRVLRRLQRQGLGGC
jgi:hypothetical protein